MEAAYEWREIISEGGSLRFDEIVRVSRGLDASMSSLSSFGRRRAVCKLRVFDETGVPIDLFRTEQNVGCVSLFDKVFLDGISKFVGETDQNKVERKKVSCVIGGCIISAFVNSRV